LTPADAFPQDILTEEGFANQGGYQSSWLDRTLALYYAADVVLDNAFAKNTSAVTCGTAPEDVTCVNKILNSLGKRAWRRPLTAEEVNTLKNIFVEAQTRGYSFRDSLQHTLRAVLISPNFIFMPEYDADLDATTARNLTGYELATRLSYFIWASTPDDQLLALAENGTLSDDNVLKAEVARMLADPKSKSLVDDFARRWLAYDRFRSKPDAAMFPNFNADLKQSMLTETRLFTEELIGKNRPIKELLTANYSFIDGNLKTLYKEMGSRDVSSVPPITIQAESYINAMDNTTANQGGASGFSKGVDVQNTTDVGGGNNVSHMEPGEWLEYKITIPADGTYQFTPRVASLSGGGVLTATVGTGANILSTTYIDVLSTGNWQTWKTLDSIHLGLLFKGENTLRIDIHGGGFNLNWFTISPTELGNPKTFARVNWLPEHHRQGILSHASILTSRSDNRNSNPALRGTWVSNKLLCNYIPSEPNSENRMLFGSGEHATLSTRQYLEGLTQDNANCLACHTYVFPLGFGLENYDAIGQWRTEETRGILAPGPWPIDATGKLFSGEIFNGPIELSNLLANTSRFPQCVINTMMTYALGRPVQGFKVGGDSDIEFSSVNKIYMDTLNEGNRFQDLVKNIVLSDAFRKRAGANSTSGDGQ
jgi:Protein of unknown function (DUF1592)/Protein of unknown function (DUF1588)/Protein of unknown function (DUF1595)/DUF5010 C-terminal domain/Protein of unknown function (DUF1585)